VPRVFKRMVKHDVEFTKFIQDNLRLMNGDFTPDAIERIDAFWRERGVLGDWHIEHGCVLMSMKSVLVEDLS
jgi:hypothetical protein